MSTRAHHISAPAYEAVEWEEYTFVENSQEHGPFSGFPRPEIDENWDKLLNGKEFDQCACSQRRKG